MATPLDMYSGMLSLIAKVPEGMKVCLARKRVGDTHTFGATQSAAIGVVNEVVIILATGK